MAVTRASARCLHGTNPYVAVLPTQRTAFLSHIALHRCWRWCTLAVRRSYQHMGRALVKCVEGCTCADSTIDAHTIEHNSQMALHHINVSQHAQCVLRVEGAQF